MNRAATFVCACTVTPAGYPDNMPGAARVPDAQLTRWLQGHPWQHHREQMPRSTRLVVHAALSLQSRVTALGIAWHDVPVIVSALDDPIETAGETAGETGGTQLGALFRGADDGQLTGTGAINTHAVAAALGSRAPISTLVPPSCGGLLAVAMATDWLGEHDVNAVVVAGVEARGNPRAGWSADVAIAALFVSSAIALKAYPSAYALAHLPTHTQTPSNKTPCVGQNLCEKLPCTAGLFALATYDNPRGVVSFSDALQTVAFDLTRLEPA